MTKLACSSCGTTKTGAFEPTGTERACDCGGSMVEPWKLKPREPLSRVSAKRESEARRRGSTLKQGRGLAASPAQQKKVRDLLCIHCGRDRHETSIQPAHVYPRRFASCDCAEGVVPLCAEAHTLYEEKKLDLLPLLLTNVYRDEFVHAIVEHEAPPMHVIEVVTGVVWAPVSEPVGEIAA